MQVSLQEKLFLKVELKNQFRLLQKDVIIKLERSIIVFLIKILIHI